MRPLEQLRRLALALEREERRYGMVPFPPESDNPELWQRALEEIGQGKYVESALGQLRRVIDDPRWTGWEALCRSTERRFAAAFQSAHEVADDGDWRATLRAVERSSALAGQRMVLQYALGCLAKEELEWVDRLLRKWRV